MQTSFLVLGAPQRTPKAKEEEVHDSRKEKETETGVLYNDGPPLLSSFLSSL